MHVMRQVITTHISSERLFYCLDPWNDFIPEITYQRFIVSLSVCTRCEVLRPLLSFYSRHLLSFKPNHDTWAFYKIQCGCKILFSQHYICTIGKKDICKYIGIFFPKKTFPNFRLGHFHDNTGCPRKCTNKTKS